MAFGLWWWKSIAYNVPGASIDGYPVGMTPRIFVSVTYSSLHRRARLAHRFAGDFQLDAMTLVHEAIQDGIGQSGLAGMRAVSAKRRI